MSTGELLIRSAQQMDDVITTERNQMTPARFQQLYAQEFKPDADTIIARDEHTQHILQHIESWPPLSAAQPTHRAGSLLVCGGKVWDGVQYVTAPAVTVSCAVPLEFDRLEWECCSP